MSEYRTEVIWRRGDQDFLDNRYSRRHVWRFDGGAEILGSSSPQVVPVPYSDELGVDPEEAFVAALASCHMLWFLSIAARRGYRVEVYRDAATGLMGRDERGRLAITLVTLRPQVRFAGEGPDPAELEAMHGEAHEDCFIANSVRTEVRCQPVLEPA
ncbi:MAG: OsmC family protein [Rhodocyclaceae bacterium]|nr:OsmC family protein [Rhodocyclaceae bacterium]